MREWGIADLALSAHATKLQRVVTVEKAQGPDVTKASSASSAAERIRTKQYLKSYSEKQLRRACQALDQKMMRLFGYDEDCAAATAPGAPRRVR